MKHLDRDELVAHFYREAGAEAATHLAGCAECAEAFAALRGDLEEIEVIEPPSRDAAYGERLWEAIAPALPAYEPRRRSWLRLTLWQGLSYAAACAVLAAGAFFAGRIFEQKQPHPAVAVKPAPQPAKPRVVVVVLSDHLDRSERLLVELKHADTETSAPLRDDARTLLAANRICLKNAGKDPELRATLERLEHLLDELAGQPEEVSPATLIRLQNEMNADGLLFEVRVLRTRVPEQQATVRSNGGTL
jgi:anti-sigma-K factor RskA